MRCLIASLVTLGGICLSTGATAATFAPQWEATIEQLSQRVDANQAVDQRLEFRQESLGLRNRVRVFEGWARFARDGQFRWQRQAPVPQVWSFDGEGLIFGEPSARNRWQVQIASGRVARDLAHITSLVSDLRLFLQDHRLAQVDRVEGGRHQLLMLALQPVQHGDFSQLGLVLDAVGGMPQSLEIEFRDGRRTRYFFTGYERLPHDEFAFRFLP